MEVCFAAWFNSSERGSIRDSYSHTTEAGSFVAPPDLRAHEAVCGHGDQCCSSMVPTLLTGVGRQALTLNGSVFGLYLGVGSSSALLTRSVGACMRGASPCR